ncbi:MAG: hypothetical protein WA085_09900, partial [Sphingobium sp.]
PVGRDALSKAMGRENVVHIAVTDKKAAARLGTALGRWQSYLGCANAAPSRVAPSKEDGVAAALGVPADQNEELACEPDGSRAQMTQVKG